MIHNPLTHKQVSVTFKQHSDGTYFQRWTCMADGCRHYDDEEIDRTTPTVIGIPRHKQSKLNIK